MREIKFRAWDHTLDKMIKNPYSLYYLDKQYNVMQYTGLKDKNGKEIYEGDIVKETKKRVEGYSCAPYTEYCWTEVVSWSDSYFAWYYGIVGLRNLENPEVIGNIHENPELLKNNP